MSKEERFAEIVKTATSCVEVVRKIEQELFRGKGIVLDFSELFYNLGYIQGLCGREGKE